ncbi:uncharacterized protein LOC141627516 [Silene latifolia]|uniref:uncharacterized protein LOC141627516 n=1 Tax=Silene latifolia TaxID=37657 RepID=UPI003D76C1EE
MVLGNDQWLLNGPLGIASFLPEGLFDHSPCIIRLWDEGKDERFKETVKVIWQQQIHGCKMFQVVKKLKLLKSPLRKLNKEGFGDILNTAKVDQPLLEDIKKKLHHDPTNISFELDERITAISYKELDEAIEDAFLEYYTDLLGSSMEVTRVNLGVVRRGRCISESQATGLIQHVSGAEIKEALFSIPIDKAPGPDGYTSCFFRDCFDIVGSDVIQAIHEFLRMTSSYNKLMLLWFP